MKTIKNSKIQTLGFLEIISLVVISISVVTIFSSIILLTLDLTSQDPAYWINKHLIYGKFAINMIFKIMIFQFFIFALSLVYKLFVNNNYEIFTVGIDYYNLITGKELHSIKILDPLFSKLAKSVLWSDSTRTSSFL